MNPLHRRLPQLTTIAAANVVYEFLGLFALAARRDGR